MKYLNLIFAILFNVGGYVLFKHISRTQMGLRWYLIFLAGLGLGAVSTFCFTQSLKSFQLSTTYPIFAAGTALLILVFTTLFYNERFSGAHLGGILLALAGIYLMTRA